MDEYILFITLIGLAAFGMAWMPAVTVRTGVSYSIIYVLAGVVLYTLFPAVLPVPLPKLNEELTVHFTEIVVIISLMGTGIKLDRPFSFKNWSSPLKLVFIAMLLCILAAFIMGYSFLGLDVESAVLLGAALAPTDPVLAADVQVGPPNEKIKSETRFALTAEAGLNDGMAFPFTWLAITLALIANGNSGNENSSSILNWFAYDFVYKISAALAIGYLLGTAAGYMVFRLTKKYNFLKTRDGFLALSLTLLVYGITELAHGYGFVAVFICAITLRHYKKGHDYYDELYSFTDQTERLLIGVLLILFGGALVNGILNALTWKMVVFTLVFLFIIRPLASYLSLFSSKINIKEKLAISFFGIRGMGSVFYLAFAIKQVHFNHMEELWSIVAFTILVSVFIHGLTATPIMNYLKENIPEEQVPD